MNKKIILSLFLTIAMIISTSSVYAKSVNTSGLSNKEISILVNKVGLTQEEISYMPTNIARDLISDGAKKLSTKGKVDYDLTSENNSQSLSGEVQPLSLTSSDISLYGQAYTVTSDKTGYTKIRLYGYFQWNINPYWNLTDKMSIGYPSTNLWFYDTSGGSILKYASNYTYRLNSDNIMRYESTSSPSNASPGIGIAAAFDVREGANISLGYVQQDVYVPNTSHGTNNVLFRYGHKLVTGSVGVDLYPTPGLSVSPSFNTETLDYWVTVSW